MSREVKKNKSKINQNIKYNICFQKQNKRKKNEEESNKATY